MRRTLVAPAALIACLGVAVAAPAATDDPAPPALGTQRAAFQEAERALRAGELTRYRTLRASLDAYPLAPYLDYAALESRLAGARPDEVARFIAANDDGPLGDRLRRRWLSTLADQSRWKAFIEFYRPDSGTRLACENLRALLATGARAEALAGARVLWLAGTSQPDACDPAFAAWIDVGGVSPQLAWERMGLAIGKGNVALARYLDRFLDPRSRQLAALWRELRARPDRVVKVFALDVDRDRAEEVAVYALERLARRQPEQAAARSSALEHNFAFSAHARGRIARAIGLSFATRRDERALTWLDRVPETQVDRTVRDWRISASILHGRWTRALDRIAGLDEREREVDRWRYWAGRSLGALGRDEEAAAAFSRAAAGRGFYAFLSADRIEAPYAFSDRPLEIPAQTIAALAREPRMRRTRELLALDRRLDARREWHHATREMGDDARAVAAKLAQSWGWHGRAILTVARTDHRDDLALRFPLAYLDAVETQAMSRGVEPPWVFAVVRQESAFMPDARSPKGALGLMQIMPATGRQLAHGLGERYRGRSGLLEPATSVRLGSAYLASLRERFGGHAALASAAYNAGPSRVRAWLPDGEPLEADLWVENIPYRETRNYVRRIMAYTAIYQHRLGLDVERLSARLPPIPTREALAGS